MHSCRNIAQDNQSKFVANVHGNQAAPLHKLVGSTFHLGHYVDAYSVLCQVETMSCEGDSNWFFHYLSYLHLLLLLVEVG